MEEPIIQSVLEKPLFTPQYLNVEYLFGKIVEFARPIVDFITSPETWSTVGLISGFLVVFCVAVIVYSIVRIFELQADEKDEINRKIEEASQKEKEKNKNENPKWKYVLTMIQSSNASDWRVAVMEADSLLEEVLREKGLTGDGVAELLESAKDGGYRSIQDAWDGHLVRNQIAHQGSDFPFSQVEARRVIKLFQNFFEELGVI